MCRLGWVGKDWNKLEWDAARKCGGWGWKQSDGIVRDGEKERKEMKGEEVVCERAEFNGKEWHEMVWARAGQTERQGWKSEGGLVWMDGEGWDGVEWEWVGWLGIWATKSGHRNKLGTKIRVIKFGFKNPGHKIWVNQVVLRLVFIVKNLGLATLPS